MFEPPMKDLAHEILRRHRFACGEAMVSRHQDDEMFAIHHLVSKVVARLRAHEGQVHPAAGECFGKVWRIVAGDHDVDVRQLVAQHLGRPWQPVHFEPGQEADVEGLPHRARRSARSLDGGIDLHQRESGVIEEDLSRIGQFHAADASAQEVDAHLAFEVADLPAQRRLRSM